jgi:hypothetical protein
MFDRPLAMAVVGQIDEALETIKSRFAGTQNAAELSEEDIARFRPRRLGIAWSRSVGCVKPPL